MLDAIYMTAEFEKELAEKLCKMLMFCTPLHAKLNLYLIKSFQ